jgi:hypothetical protein
VKRKTGKHRFGGQKYTADSTNGRLHEGWIDTDQQAEASREQIAQMPAESKEPILVELIA